MWMLTTAAERDDISEDLRHFFLEPLLRVSTLLLPAASSTVNLTAVAAGPNGTVTLYVVS
jgi:hypothetical protein